MSERKIYLTTWKRTDAGYRVWVKARPKLFAEGLTFEDADRRLWEVIGLATGDGENLHEYVPAAPTLESAGPADRGRLWQLAIQSGSRMVDAAALFEGGLCDACLMPRGPRTDVLLAVDGIEGGVQASSVSLPRRPPGVGPVLSVFSEDFLALLTDEERNRFEWRALVPSKRRKRDFFELVHLTPPVPTVGLIGHETYYGVCDRCGWRWIVPRHVKGRPSAYVSEANVPQQYGSVFAVGNWANSRLTAFDVRWSELIGRPGLKGIAGVPAAIIAVEDVEPDPVYVPRPAENS